MINVGGDEEKYIVGIALYGYECNAKKMKQYMIGYLKSIPSRAHILRQVIEEKYPQYLEMCDKLLVLK